VTTAATDRAIVRALVIESIPGVVVGPDVVPEPQDTARDEAAIAAAGAALHARFPR